MRLVWISLALFASFASVGCVTTTCKPLTPRYSVTVSDDFSKPSAEPSVSVTVSFQ